MSIKKIAQLTGSSPATVSRVLNNPQYKCSKPGLREKIWKTAMELNYTPNEAARNLKKGEVQREKAYYIDILMTRMDGKHTDPFFTELLRVVESQIHDHGCILSHIWYRSIFSDDRKCERYSIASLLAELFAEMDTSRQGLILIGRCNPQVVKELKKYYKNIVSINRNSTNYEIDEVLCDGRKIAAAALEHLIRPKFPAAEYSPVPPLPSSIRIRYQIDFCLHAAKVCINEDEKLSWYLTSFPSPCFTGSGCFNYVLRAKLTSGRK